MSTEMYEMIMISCKLAQWKPYLGMKGKVHHITCREGTEGE
jgi:hypothetical protein